jgi:hypothetical protein
MKRLPSFLLLASGILIGLLCGAVITTAYSDQVKFTYDQVVGQAGETQITRGQLAEKALAKKSVRTSLGMELLTGEMQDRALVAEAARRAGVTVTADEINARIAELAQFAENGLAKSQLDAYRRPEQVELVRSTLLAEKMMHITVSEEEAREYYMRHPSLFIVPAMAKLVVINTTNRNKALQAKTQLEQGKDAQALSQLYSTDKSLRDAKGYVGWVLRSNMGPQVSDAIYGTNDQPALKAGEWTDVLTIQSPNPDPAAATSTITEYVIFYVTDIQNNVVKKFDEVHDAVMFYCHLDKYYAQAPAWFKEQAQKIPWQQVKDLDDPQAHLDTIPINPNKWDKATDADAGK